MEERPGNELLQQALLPQKYSRKWEFNAISGSSLMVFAFLALIIAFVVAVRVQFFHIPFERDEGTYCYMGQLVLDGKIPYVDFYEMKPPLLFYSYAAIISLFGKTVEGVHCAFMLLNIFTVIFLYFIGMKLLGKVAGLITAASYAILSLAPFVSGFTVQSEHIISFFATAGLLVILLGFEKKKNFYFFFGGALLCASFLIKQNGIFFITFAGIITAIYGLMQKPVKWMQLIKWLSYFVAGSIVPLAIVVSVLYFQGALKEAFFWTYSYAHGYVSTVTIKDGLDSVKGLLSETLDGNLFMWMIAGALIILPVLGSKKISLFTRVFVFLFVVMSFLAVTPGLRFYGHYFIFFMPAVALLVATAIVSIKNMLSKYLATGKATLIAVTVFAVVILCNIFSQREYYFYHDDTDVLRMVYNGNPFPEAKVVGDYIRKNSTESDSIAVFGSEPEIYFYSDRRCPSKYCDCAALYNPSSRTPFFQKEFERDMRTSVPKYFVVFRNLSSVPTAGEDFTIFSWLNSFLIENYRPVCMIDMASSDKTQYIWGKDVDSYKMSSSVKGFIFERIEKNKTICKKI